MLPTDRPSRRLTVLALSIEDGLGVLRDNPRTISQLTPKRVRAGCFEVKDEAASSYLMRRLEMMKGYPGPAQFLRYRKASDYLSFSDDLLKVIVPG